MTVLFMRNGSAVNLAYIDAIEPIGTGGHCKVFFAGSNEYLTMQARDVITAAWKQWLEAEDRLIEPLTITQAEIEQQMREASDNAQQRIQQALMKERRV